MFTYWWFDSEDHPMKNGWYGVVLVMAANGDLGETPVVGIVWTNAEFSSDNAFEIVADTTTNITDGIIVKAVTSRAECPATSLAISERENKIYANGTFVGRIKN